MADTDEHAENNNVVKARNAEKNVVNAENSDEVNARNAESIESAVRLNIKCNSCKCKRLE